MKVEENVLLNRYSTFGIGGPARYFITATTKEELSEAISFASQKSLPYHLLGKGSNSLFDDRGFRGVVIYNRIIHYKQDEALFHVGSGFSFALLGVRSAKANYSGLEFASGIPATVGGAIYMNAGANGQETKDCLVEVELVDEKGQISTKPKNELQFAYRFSSFQNQKLAIAGATFKLEPCSEASAKQSAILDYRLKTQPYGDKSCGCIFQNPPEAFAGQLIEAANLKGVSIGGAAVSKQHANFIINQAQATSADVLELIDEIQTRVKQQFGYELKSEVRNIPYD